MPRPGWRAAGAVRSHEPTRGRPALGGHPHLARLTLNRLGRAASEAIVGTLAGSTQLPDEVVATILGRSDGVPLFVEELTKAVLDTAWAGPGMTVPASLHNSLMARLDRLAPVKEVAQLAACIGREFDFELLAAVAPLAETELVAALDRLQAAELIFRRGTPPKARFTFKHALVRDAAYASLLRHRRQAFHGMIYQALSSPTHSTPPDTLAVHSAGAGLLLEAAQHGLDAGRRALARWAPREAAQHLRRSLAQLGEVRDGPDRRLLEFELQGLLAPVLVATSGYSADATGDAYARTAELARVLDQPAKFAQAQFGEFLFRLVRGELRTAASVADRMLDGAATSAEDANLAMAHRASGTSAFFMGELASAAHHLGEAQARLESARRKPTAGEYLFDPATGIAVFGSLAWLAIGRLDRADELQARSGVLAEAAAHVATVAFDHHHACFFAMASGRPEEARRRAEAMVQLALEERLPIWLATGRVYLGWAMAVASGGGEGLDVLDDGLSRWKATGARLWLPVYLGLRADALVATGRRKEAMALLEEALALAAATNDAHFITELRRRLAALQKEDGKLETAEATLLVAVQTARDQGAHLYELRAAADLARLWAEDGRRKEGYNLLSEAQGWFDKGLEHPVVEGARWLLNTLR